MTDANDRLVGRDQPLARLSAALTEDHPVAVIGEAGIGKTTLIRVAVGSTGRRLVEGGGFATLRSMPYLPLSRAVGVALNGDPVHVAVIVERHVGPDVLFIDDLQWADAGTYTVIDLLAKRIQLVVAIREGDAAATAATESAGRRSMVQVELTGLDNDAARTLVKRIRPDLRGSAVDAIVARASGNPLLLEELARDGRPAPIVGRTLEARVARLSSGARRVVRMLALADRPLPRARLGPEVDEVRRAGLADERDGMVEIHHAILAESIRTGLTTTQRRRVHRELDAGTDDPFEIARHLAAGGRSEEAAAVARGALDTTRDPADRATLLTLVAGDGSATTRFERRLEAARLLDQLSDWDRVAEVLSAVGSKGSADQRTERDALMIHATFARGDIAAARGWLEAADDERPVRTGSAAVRRALEAAEFLVNVDGSVAEALALLDEQINIMRPDPSADADLRSLRASITMLATGSVDLDLLRASADDAYDAGRYRTAADRARVAQYALLMSVGAQAALDYATEQSARFAAAGATGVALVFRAETVAAAILAGRPRDAVALADELLESPTPIRVRQPGTIFRARALAMLGGFDEALGSMGELESSSTADFFGTGEWLAAQADIAFWAGRPDRSVDLAERCLAVRSPVPSAAVLPAVTLAWARYERGDRSEPTIEPVGVPAVAGAGPEISGLRAMIRGEDAAAAIAFQSAADTWRGFHEPRSTFCLWAAGESIRRAGDRDGAIEHLRATLESADEMGFEPLAARSRRSLRLAGIRLAATRGPRDTTGLRLTPREREMVGLVERGLTNAEIARRLGLGRPTVTRILASAMQKRGAARRTQLVGLSDPS